MSTTGAPGARSLRHMFATTAMNKTVATEMTMGGRSVNSPNAVPVL